MFSPKRSVRVDGERVVDRADGLPELGDSHVRPGGELPHERGTAQPLVRGDELQAGTDRGAALADQFEAAAALEGDAQALVIEAAELLDKGNAKLEQALALLQEM